MKLIITGIAFICSFFSFFYFINKYNETVRVEGTVIGSTQQAKSNYHSTTVYTDYRLAVHPDNTEEFKDFDTSVDFATVCKFKIGDKIVFPNINQQEVMINPPAYNFEIWTSIIIMLVSAAIIIILLTLI